MDQVGGREPVTCFGKNETPVIIDTRLSNGDGKNSNIEGNDDASGDIRTAITTNNHDEGDALGSRTVHQRVCARMVTERKATHYKMDHERRGVALIFNQESFRPELGLKARAGTDKDCEALESSLKQIGFEVHVFKDLDYNDLITHVETFARMDHSNNDCFIMSILSHGELGIIYARDIAFRSERLWSPFAADKCPTLAGKPKLFFIQACQGDKLDGGITLSRTETDGQSMNAYRIPTQADFLIAYSTVPGYYSWRNTTRGSWFIQALCEELTANAYNYDLLKLLTFVSQSVALDYESNCPDTPHMHGQKQIPVITTMLTRICQFTKPGSQSLDNETSKEQKPKDKSKNIWKQMFPSKSHKGYNVHRIDYSV